MSDTSETKGGLRRGRRAAFTATIVAALTLAAPLAGAAGDGVSIESNAAAFRASAGAARLPVDLAVLAPPITVPTTAPTVSSAVRAAVSTPASSSTTIAAATAAPARVEVAPSFMNDILGLLGRSLGALLNALGGAVRTAPASPPPSSTSTSSTSTTSTSTTSTSTTVPVTTPTTLACRNSTNPACGPFRFDPQPAPDRPMTVQVVAEPATVAAGQTVVFRLTLVDPDGVSHNASRFMFGESGIVESSGVACTKFGPWDPPAPDPSRATEVDEVSHTYFQAGSYTATFEFYPDPFGCVDSVTGRGDRPYASYGIGSVAVVVTP